MKDRLLGREKLDGLFSLKPSKLSHQEIAELATGVSMKLRRRNAFDSYRGLLDQPDVFDEIGYPTVSLAPSSENGRLLEMTRSSKGMCLRKQNGQPKFTIFLNPPCSIFQLNKTIALLLANSILHIDASKIQSDFCLFDVSNVDDSVRRQAAVFAETFIFPPPLVREYVEFLQTSPSELASLLGARLEDFKTEAAVELLRSLSATPHRLAS